MKGNSKIGLGLVIASMIVSGRVGAVSVDTAIPADQSKSIQADQAYLNKLQYQNNEADRTTARLLGIRGPLTAQKLQGWLDERVNVVISENQDLNASILAAPGTAVYPEANVFPALESPKPKPATDPAPKPQSADAPKPVVVMANIGAALYMMGKQSKVLLALKKTDGSLLPLVSPHGGFIQIGRGLFLERLRVNPAAQDLPANSVERLSTFFHESRHSDGHGKSLGFMHAICPEGHPYAGYAACDKNLNGPYTVGAQMLKTLAQACGECSVKEKTILKMIEADSRSRIMKTYQDESGKKVVATNWSDRFEKILKYSNARN